MEPFRFGIMGAGNISRRFVKACHNLENVIVTSVSSKSEERLQNFSKDTGVTSLYLSYEEMLQKEKPDAVYIGTTPESHFELTMLCLKYGVPVLCEKAMFMTEKECKIAEALSKKNQVFFMEGTWSRHLPTLSFAKKLISDGKIGTLKSIYTSVGFKFDPVENKRNFDPKRGGGAAFDLTIYGYQINDYFVPDITPCFDMVTARFSDTGIDYNNHVRYHKSDVTMEVYTSCIEMVDEKTVITGTDGRIIIPHAHWGRDVFLYDKYGNEIICFEDTETLDGFEYEILELIKRVQEKQIESDVVPHKLSRESARLYDMIYRLKN